MSVKKGYIINKSIINKMSLELVVMSSNFNASISVTELLMKTLENCAKDLASRCIIESAKRHGFDGNEEIRALGLEKLVIIRKQMTRHPVSKKNNDNKKNVKHPVFPMPFMYESIDIACCQGLVYNRGLFTQCKKKRIGKFCNGCQLASEKNASGQPDCGTVDTRMSSGLYEFKDPKGRSPISYIKFLEKLKLSEDAAKEEAGKLNINIPNEHFVNPKEKSNKSLVCRGRPSKSSVIEVDNVTDLFAKLSCISEEEEEVIEVSTEQIPMKPSFKEEDKNAKKIALEEERAVKKQEREAKLVAEKQEREAKVAAEKQQREEKRLAEAELKKQEREAKVAAEVELKKQQREAKVAAEKQEREAKVAAEIELKKQQREEKRLAEAELKKQEREAKVASEKKVATEKKETVKTTLAKEESKEDEKTSDNQETTPPTKVSVSRVQIGGKPYLKSTTNILYDPATKEEVGLWDSETKTIKELPEDDDEVEEEDYESD